MNEIELFAFALGCGLTIAGCCATLMEIASARRISFSPPFAVRGRPARSLVVTVCAGPMMLFSDALLAYRQSEIGRTALVGCAATALAWSLALGIVVLHLATLVVSFAARIN